ncbi:MAG: ATP-binding protein [Hyphomicrobiaceae bacterium]
MTLWLSWSSGKDSAWTLHELRAAGVEVTALFTTINEATDRVAMHGVRRSLLEAQAAAAGLPLHILPLPWPCTNADYETIMGRFVADARAGGVTRMAFGDLYLEDIRRYREANLSGTGIEPVFPLWGRPTRALATDMIGSGLKAIVTAVDLSRIPAAFAGRRFDEDMVDALPDAADACGENGEFHTLVIAGPMFARPLAVELGEVVERDGIAFADVRPADAAVDA